jgi:predicted MFS family arabinose efflux permease
MLTALKTRDYRLLWSGQAISHFGDQFHLIALPWLVLTLTHDPLQLGIVLALAGIPRAALMLLGGAFADRHSPRTIMLVSDVVRFALVGVLGVAVLTGSVRLWMVYVLAVGFGVVSGFFMPAAEAALPRLLPKDELEGGNALMMGVDQLASFVGPSAAGTLIAAFGASASGAAGLVGVGVALLVDSVSFLVSAATLVLIRALPALGAGSDRHPLAAVVDGLRFAMSRPGFRWMLGMVAGANMALVGPLTVGVPVLAQTRFVEGVAAYGMILAAYGIGNLLGMIGAGTLPRLSSGAFSVAVVSLFIGFGIVIASLAVIKSAWLAAALMVVLGLGNGYIAVTLISTLQRVTPPEMLGRVMSLMMLGMIGLVPLSQAVTGAALKLGPAPVFGAAGLGIALLGVGAAIRHRSWSIDAFEGAAAPAVPAASEAA